MTVISLRALQSAHTERIAKLILFAVSQGYEMTWGETYRSPEEAARLAQRKTGAAIARSLHCDRLAADLNLFRNGVWLTQTEDHAPLGQYWESLSTPGISCVWGGSWGADGNHYSIAFQGRK